MNKIKYYLIAITVPLLIILISGNAKAAFFIDELLSYELANQDNNGYFYVDFEDGKEYTGEEILMDSVLTGRNKRFNYHNVWLNQSNDVHPPFYYALLHTVCSCMPYIFSKWQGIMINILFGGLTLLFLYKLSLKFTGSEIVSAVITLGCGLTESFIDAGILIRMYMMLNMAVMILSYLLFKLLYDKKIKNHLYFMIFLITVTGTLTQYFFLIYLFFIAGFSVLYLLYKKRIGDLIKFIIVMLCAGMVSYLVFPPMIFHIFKGYRGKESFNNLVSLSKVSSRLYVYLESFIKGTVSVLVIPVMIAIAAVLIYKYAVCRGNIKSGLLRILPFLLSCTGMVVIVAKISPQIAGRYIWCICPVGFSCIFSMLYLALDGSVSIKKNMIIVCIAAVLCGGLTLSGGLGFDYDEYIPTITNVSKYSGTECIYLYKDEYFYLTVTNYPELKDYGSVTYYSDKNFDVDSFRYDTDKAKVILIMDVIDDNEKLLDKICLKGGYDKLELLTRNGLDFGVKSYLLRKD